MLPTPEDTTMLKTIFFLLAIVLLCWLGNDGKLSIDK